MKDVDCKNSHHQTELGSDGEQIERDKIRFTLYFSLFSATESKQSYADFITYVNKTGPKLSTRIS